MNDVKLNPVVPAGPQAGSAGIASSAPQPSNSRPAVSEQAPDTSSLRPENAQKAQGKEPVQNKDQQKAQVQEAVSKLNEFIQSVQRDLEFNLDEDAGKVVVKVIDRNTSEVVRQIPDEVALKLARDLQSDEPLSLFNTKA